MVYALIVSLRVKPDMVDADLPEAVR